MKTSKYGCSRTVVFIWLIASTLIAGCSEDSAKVQLQLFLMGSDTNTAEYSGYATRIASMLDQKFDLDGIDELDVVLTDRRLTEVQYKLEFSALMAKQERLDSLIDSLSTFLKRSNWSREVDNRYQTGLLQMTIERSKQLHKSNALLAIVGRLATCHNDSVNLGRTVKSLTSNRDSLPSMLWIVPGTRSSDAKLRTLFETRYEVWVDPLTVPNYDECNSDSIMVSRSGLSRILSFAQTNLEADRIAREIVAIDSSGYYDVYRDGDSSILSIRITDKTKIVSELGRALFNGNRPQFSSVNYLLKLALNQWPTYRKGTGPQRLIVAGNMPRLDVKTTGKGIVTSEGDLKKLDPTVEVVFIQSSNTSQINIAFKDACAMLGHKTKVRVYGN